MADPGGGRVTSLDTQIRSAAGRGEPAAAHTDDEPDDQKRQAAKLAGVPVEHAHRLAGDTPQELLADAKRFVAETGITRPRTSSDAGVREPALTQTGQSMDDLVRGTRLQSRREAAAEAEGFRQLREASQQPGNAA